MRESLGAETLPALVSIVLPDSPARLRQVDANFLSRAQLWTESRWCA